MGMLEALEKEQAKRQLIALEKEQESRKNAISGTPNIIEEQHEGVSNFDRFHLKNLGKDANSNAAYLAKNNPQLDTRVWDGRVLVKNKNEKEWRTMDPDAEGIDGIGEFIKDTGDIAYDVGSGIVEGVGTAAAAGAGFLFGGAGSVPLAMGANAALGAGSEAVRQGLGTLTGVNEGVDMGDVAMTGALSGVIPMVPGAVMKGLRGAKNTGKSALKFLGNVDDKNIARMQAEGAEDYLSKIEGETIVPTIRDAAEKRRELLTSAQEEQIARVDDLKGRFNIEDDVELENYLRAEEKALVDSGQFGDQLNAVRQGIADIPETRAVRAKIKELGSVDEKQLTREAFPKAIDAVEDAEGFSQKAKAMFQERIAEEGKRYAKLYEGKKVPANFIEELKNDYVKKNFSEAELLTDAGQKAVKAIDNYFNSNFMINNSGNLQTVKTVTKGGTNEYKYKALKDITPEQMAEKGIPRDKYLPQSSNFDGMVDESITATTRANTVTGVNAKKSINEALGVGSGTTPSEKYVSFKNLSANDVQDFMNVASEEANWAKGLGAQINPTKKLKVVSKFAQSLKMGMSEKFDEMLGGQKGLIDSKYKEVVQARTLADSLFNTDKKSLATMNKALKGDQYTINQIKKIDGVLGSNFGEEIEYTLKSIKTTKSAINQAKIANSAKEFATALAERNKPKREKMLEELKGSFNSDQQFENAVGAYRTKVSNIFNDDIDKLDAKYDLGGDSVKKIAEDLDFLSAFGDAAKTKVKEMGKGEAANVLRGISQSAGWNVPGLGGAGFAQVTGTVGKAIGEKLPIKKILRKRLPQYAKGKKWYNGWSAKKKRQFEEDMVGTILSRRDVIRELSKKLGNDSTKD